MPAGEVRYMWLFVLFDLPVGTKRQRKIAMTFRKFLIKDGYFMLQYSVYIRVCRGTEAVDKHVARLAQAVPKKGSVRSLSVTTRQYDRMRLLAGTRFNFEESAHEQLVFL